MDRKSLKTECSLIGVDDVLDTDRIDAGVTPVSTSLTW
jgi:hypothetical protein